MAGTVSAILLAAGLSRRMGAAKTLLPLGNIPAVRVCAETLAAAGIDDIIVVTGPDPAGVEQALEGTHVRFARNGRSESEMAESVRSGIGLLPRTATAALVFLSDHPLVRPGTVRALVLAHASEPGKIIVPVFEGRNGHPTLFPVSVIRELFTCQTLRDVVRSDRSRVVSIEVADEGVILDMDTPEDYRRMSGERS